MSKEERKRNECQRKSREFIDKWRAAQAMQRRIDDSKATAERLLTA